MPVTITLDPTSDGFLIEFPPLPGNHRTHHAKLPCTLAGLFALRRILRKRADAEEACTIGTPGAPTSHQIEVIIAALDRAPTAVTAAADDFLRHQREIEREARRNKPSGPSHKIKNNRVPAFSLADLDLEI